MTKEIENIIEIHGCNLKLEVGNGLSNIEARNIINNAVKQALSLTDVVSSKRLNLVVFEDYTRCYKVSDKELEQLKKDGDIEDGDIVCKVEVIKEY